MQKNMKYLFTFLSLMGATTQVVSAANEQPVLACVTAYWRSEGCGFRASSSGARLRENDCAVDPAKIPFGSRVIFEDANCHAVDSGPDVTNRKAARLSGRNARQRDAIVIDRFFETKEKAMEWTERHPKFVNVWVIPPGKKVAQQNRRVSLELDLTKTLFP
jgi:3D (Asp-Asp-Asp) domain-containing protein